MADNNLLEDVDVQHNSNAYRTLIEQTLKEQPTDIEMSEGEHRELLQKSNNSEEISYDSQIYKEIPQDGQMSGEVYKELPLERQDSKELSWSSQDYKELPQELQIENQDPVNYTSQDPASLQIASQDTANQQVASQNSTSLWKSCQDSISLQVSTQDVASLHVASQDLASQQVATQDPACLQVITPEGQQVSNQDPATPNVASQDPANQQVVSQDSANLQVASQNSTSLLVACQDSTSLQVSTQDVACLHVASEDFASLQVATQDPAGLQVIRQNLASQQVSTQDPVTPQVASQDPVILQVTSEDPTSQQFATQNLANIQIATQGPASLQVARQDLASLHCASQDPAVLQVTIKDPTSLQQLQLTSQNPANLQVTSQHPARLQVTSQDPASIQIASEDRASHQIATQDPASVQVASQDRASQQIATQDPTSLQVYTQDPASQQVATQDPASLQLAKQDAAGGFLVASQYPTRQQIAIQDPTNLQVASPTSLQVTSGSLQVFTQDTASLQIASQNPANLHVSTQHPASLQVSTQDPASLLVASQNPTSLQVSTQDNASLQIAIQDPTTLQFVSPTNLQVASQNPANLQVSTHDPASQVASQDPTSLQVSTQYPASLQVPTQDPASLLVASQNPTSLQVSTQNNASLQVASQYPACLHVATQDPARLKVTSQYNANLQVASQVNLQATSQYPVILQVASQDLTRQQSTSQDPASPRLTSQDSASLQFASQNSTSQQVVSQDPARLHVASEDPTILHVASKDLPRLPFANHGHTNRSVASKDTVIQQITGQEDPTHYLTGSSRKDKENQQVHNPYHENLKHGTQNTTTPPSQLLIESHSFDDNHFSADSQVSEVQKKIYEVSDNDKECPKCKNKICAKDNFCRHCGQQFLDISNVTTPFDGKEPISTIFHENENEQTERKVKKKALLETTFEGCDETYNNLYGYCGDSHFYAVKFHVIVPTALWEDFQSIVLRFGKNILGNWRQDIGEFITDKQTEEELVMSCEIKFKAKWLNEKIPYKYFIYTKSKGEYEHLDTFSLHSRKDVNRCLSTPSCSEKGIYHQYDGIVLPAQPSFSLYSFIGNFLKGTPKDGNRKYNIIMYSQTRSLHLFLDYYVALFTDIDMKKDLCEEIVNGMYNVFKQLQHQTCFLGDDYYGKYYRPVEKFDKSFLEWICQAAQYVGSSIKKLGPALVLITAAYNICSEYSYSMPHDMLHPISVLFSILLPETMDSKEELTNEKEMLLRFVQENYRYTVCDSLVFFAKELMSVYKLSWPSWTRALPIINILTQKIWLRQGEIIDTTNYPSKRCILNLPTYKTLEECSLKDMSVFKEQLLPMQNMDPNIVPQLLIICPRSELVFLFEQIKVYISAAFIKKILLSNNQVYMDYRKQAEKVPKLLDKLIEIMQRNEMPMTEQEATWTLASARQLHDKVFNNTKGDFSQNLELVTSTLQFLLLSLSEVMDKNAEGSVMCKQGVMMEIKISLSKKYCVSIRSNINKEIEIMEQLSKIPCPQKVETTWTAILSEVFSKQMEKIKAKNDSIKLLTKLEAIDSSNELVINAITETIMHSSEFMNPTEGWLKSFSQERLAAILHSIMVKKFPETTVEINLINLLEWNYWPLFFSFYLSDGNRKKQEKPCFSSHVGLLCTAAYSKLQDIFKLCLSGDITLNEINEIKKYQNSGILKKLHEVIQPTCSEDELKYFNMSYVIIRIKEADAFMAKKKLLSYFCQELSNRKADIKGLSSLYNETKKDYDKEEIKSLCRSEESEVIILVFKSAKCISIILHNFSILFKKYPNNFMSKFLEITLADSKNTNQSLESFHHEIWDQVYEKGHLFVQSLKDKSIKLQDVENLCSNYDLKEDKIKSHLHELHSSMEKCNGREPKSNPEEWIYDAIKHINICWSLKQQSKAANFILVIKDKLSLLGDFKEVENVSRTLTTSMNSKPLSYVSESMISKVQFFKDISLDSSKFECIEAFSVSENIIKWIQKETKEVNDLHKFVGVALHTSAGEDDFSHDKLSQLKIVGSGYGPLIYQLKEMFDFKSFVENCQKVWLSLKQTPKLPSLLKACNKELQWFKSVKETQGSVEVTSIGQMNSILNNGSYLVGSARPEFHQNLSDVINLKLREKDKESRIVKKKYSLEELHDLESKLVLITGRKAVYRNEVELFLGILHRVRHIADLLLSLQQVGNVKYIGWSLQVPCSAKSNLIDRLQDQINEMEAELESWNHSVKCMRDDYYELNYYTTSQMLTLRQSLAKFKYTEAVNLEAEILFLLQSINPEVESKLVEGAIVVVIKETLDFEETEVTKKVDDGESRDNIEKPSKIDGKLRNDLPKELECANEKELSENQKMMMTFVIQKMKFTENLVLKALEKYPNIEDKVDFLPLCVKLHNENSDSEDASCSDESETSSSDQYEYDDAVSTSKAEVVPTYVQSKVKIKKKHAPILQKVTQHHEFVKKLVEECAYEENLAIKAVECTHAKSLSAALAFIDNHEEYSSHHLSEEVNHKDGESNINWVEVTEMVIQMDFEAEKKYLTVKELGKTLKILSDSSIRGSEMKRSFPTNTLKEGYPNLVVVKAEEVFMTVLHLYKQSAELPLPSPEEVYICSQSTSAEEIELFWRRAIRDPDYTRIFCLVHTEKLSNLVCDSALQSLFELSQAKQGYRLVILYCNIDEKESHLLIKLQNYRRLFVVENDVNLYRDYLLTKFKCIDLTNSAAKVDCESSCVRVIISDRSAMGKSLYAKRLGEELAQYGLGSVSSNVAIIPLQGPIVNNDILLQLLERYKNNSTTCIYHIDISSSVNSQVSAILFNLLVLRGISDSHGNVWRCHPNQLYVVEITIPNFSNIHTNDPQFLTVSLLNMLPSIKCLKPTNALSALKDSHNSPLELAVDQRMFETDSHQRVYSYLKTYFKMSSIKEGSPTEVLEYFLRGCSINNPSWAELFHFVKFLDAQLQDCEKSGFTKSNDDNILKGFKGFVVKFMIKMAKDFSTSSLKGEVAIENSEDLLLDNNLTMYEIHEGKKWEDNPHPYIFFNNDHDSFTFVGFVIKLRGNMGNLINPYNNDILEDSIITRHLYRELQANGINFEDNCRLWEKKDMLNKLEKIMGIENLIDPDETYVLTMDNLIKMLAIQMRFRCGIPVVVMGETGCGKTRLIRYMCDLDRQGKDATNMLIMKVHGGKNEEDIKKFVDSAKLKAAENTKLGLRTIVFFDEANTTEALDLIKEILCDYRIKGISIKSDLHFIAACNPYRKHNDEMIARLENAGLGYFIKEDATQKLGKIPLRHLVYRVLDLPPSMRPLVYDFGRLNEQTEMDYIDQIVKNHVRNHATLSQLDQLTCFEKSIAVILKKAQRYMRKKNDECSFVSLRDVDRAMLVLEYFYEKRSLYGEHIKKWTDTHLEGKDRKDVLDYTQTSHCITRAVILSISVCYRARLHDRENFDSEISECFVDPISLSSGVTQFRAEIRWCEEVLLDKMRIGDNIARNAALRENVFMMVICIELKIPLFLVGKPGSSKSLAKAIISDSMRGNDSTTKLLKDFNEVQILSYQCSQLSTSSSIIKLFNDAKKYQDSEKQNKKSFVAVVVLDEVGLAEDSPNLPLKSLHPLLEDGTEGNGDDDFFYKVVDRKDRVTFIGISNWALDPAKMNRGIMVTRNDPSEDELVFSARGICSNEKDDPILLKLQKYFSALARAYSSICQLQKREFFGLRDFYSLIKMLYNMCNETQSYLTWKQLEHAIKRNFGGFQSDELKPYSIFEQYLMKDHRKELEHHQDSADKKSTITHPDSSRLGLIRSSLSTNSWHIENRYPLFLTENYAALEILKNPKFLQIGGISRHAKMKGKVDQPFILFGSSFPKDKEYTQVCRNINQIKICMETGRTVILLNLENLYESLYDVLNQYYVVHAGSRYVDLGLQTHRVRCRVADNFRLILIAEKRTVYQKFPTPLINRMEKHFVLISSVLEKWQEELLVDFKSWISQYSLLRLSKFKESDAFVGFQKDTPASILFYATNQMRLACDEIMNNDNQSTNQKFYDILKYSNIKPDQYNIEKDYPEKWKSSVLRFSKFLILQTATPDSLFRLKNTNLSENEYRSVHHTYFKEQYHDSVQHFVRHYLHHHDQERLLMQITTHSHLLSSADVDIICSNLGITGHSYSLQMFDTELDFSNKIGPKFKKREGKEILDTLVVIQCYSGHLHGDLIACARHRIYDLMAKGDQEQITHVLFVIRLPRQLSCSLVGFQGDPWISCHIDDLIPAEADNSIDLNQIMEGDSISDVFIGLPKENSYQISSEEEDINAMEIELLGIDDDKTYSRMNKLELSQHYNSIAYFSKLYKCIQPAASKLKDITMKRSTERVKLLVNLIPSNIAKIDDSQFHGIVINYIHTLLKKKEELFEGEKYWIFQESLNNKNLLQGGTWRNVLFRRVKAAVVEVFAEIISIIDQNCNLNLINPDECDDAVRQLWLKLFSDHQIMEFKFSDFVKKEDYLPGIGARKSKEDFGGRFPFSWILYEIITGLLEKVKISREKVFADMKKQLSESIMKTFVGKVLQQFDNFSLDRYLYDFVHLIPVSAKTIPNVQQKYYELLSASLHALVNSHYDGESLIDKIASLHIVYHLHNTHLLWFGQLVRYNPSSIVTLTSDKVRDAREMILPICATDKALDSMKLVVDKDSSLINIYPWLHDLHNSQSILTSILDTTSCNSMKKVVVKKWHFFRIIQLFVENIMMPHPSVPVHVLLRLYYLMDNADFLTAETLLCVQKHLNKFVREATHKGDNKRPKGYISANEKRDFEDHCQNYFMDIISSLCFGQDTPPETELIEMLMKIVFLDGHTRELTHNIGGKKDRKPTIRSLLLQLLLRYRKTEAKEYVEKYFQSSQQILSKDNSCYLYLMCLQCFEDTLQRDNMVNGNNTIQVVTKCLKESIRKLNKLNVCKDMTVISLETIASIRFYLQKAAELYSSCCSDATTNLPVELNTLSEQVMILSTSKSLSMMINSSFTGPGIYFIRLLVREYGYSFMLKLSKINEWMIPEHLSVSDQSTMLDPFIVYNDSFGYTSVRADILGVTKGRQINLLNTLTEGMNLVNSVIYLLALFQAVSLSNVTTIMDEEIVEHFDQSLRNMKIFTPEMLLMARLLLTNAQGGILHQLKITHDQTQLDKELSLIVVHANLVLLCHSNYDILLPFVNMAHNARALSKSFLPTMFEDSFVDEPEAVGAFYACPNGHPYFVGQCDKPMEVRSCNICSAPIGRPDHTLRKGSVVARSNDATQIGYLFGEANTRPSMAIPERSLSSVAVSIMRIIMHSAFVWFSCHHNDYIGDLSNIVQCSVLPDHLAEFFWMHLQKDIEQLSFTIGKNRYEATILIHLVLKRILVENPPNDFEDAINNSKLLRSKIARQTWEEIFCAHYITPLLEDQDILLNETMNKIVKDSSLEHDPLLNAAYEIEPVTEESLEMHFWTYKQKVSLEHLRCSLQQEDMKQKYALLYDFLQLEPKLRATQYLSHIIKLQHKLYDHCNFRMDKAIAVYRTIDEFIDRIPNESSRNEYRQWINSLQKAWALVGQDLKIHGRMPVPDSIFPSSITGNTSLSHIIPTTTGAGVCTTSLVDFLVLTHNTFIERCYADIAEGQDRDYQKQLWKNEVPISQIQGCHLLDYENQIISVILSHTHYSLRTGEAHTVTYDLKSLQKHILDKFIYGKPIILSDIPEVVYRNDIHTTDTFEAVRSKVKPQEKIDSQIRNEILNEVCTPEALRANLDIIDIVLGFLSSGGGKANKSMGNYIEKVLQMKKGSFSRKAQEYCKLKHTLSLWEILSVELAKTTWIRNQEPFEDVISHNFLEYLTENEKIALDRCLRVFDLNRLLNALHEFIVTSARYYTGNQLTWTLTTVLIQEKYKNLQLPNNFEVEFPKTITVAQTVATWKHIVNYQEENK